MGNCPLFLMPSYKMIKQGMKPGSNIGPKGKKETKSKKKRKLSMQSFYYSGKHKK